ncbi:hypothetical protein [Fusobacterium sp.]|uniref:LolA family protein n=1 Tax=Fusobacterium sp. TaxID=68766 RepID=UPI0028FDE7FD|nr:hypothetical protein [Fusobacterium sp.]MDU1911306.1 hypothetical protein [Fusobacterium sp.]
MKKWILTCFLLIFFTAFSSEKRISDIKNLAFSTQEILVVNGKERETGYDVKFQVPDKIKKEITFPELNKGELYIYNGNEKTIYLPIFQQISHEKISNDENRIIEVINYIFEKEKKDINFRKKYYNNEIKEISLEDGVTIKFSKFERTNGYLLPVSFELFDDEIKIGLINIINYQIDPKFDEKEFVLE